MRSAGFGRSAEKSSLLDLVDVRLEPVDGGLVVVDDPVDDRVEHRAGPVLEQLGVALELLAHAVQRAGLAVADGDHEVRRRGRRGSRRAR